MSEPQATLERDLQRLHEIVERLERQELELDRAIALFEEGTRLLREAEQLLSRAEGRLRQWEEVGGAGGGAGDAARERP